MQRCMELFLAYPFNNALHRHVATLLLAFDSGSDAVIDFLLGDCKLLTWLATAPEQVGVEPLRLRRLPAGCRDCWQDARPLRTSCRACELCAPRGAEEDLCRSCTAGWLRRPAAARCRSTPPRGKATRVPASGNLGARGTLATSRCWPTSSYKWRQRGHR